MYKSVLQRWIDKGSLIRIASRLSQGEMDRIGRKSLSRPALIALAIFISLLVAGCETMVKSDSARSEEASPPVAAPVGFPLLSQLSTMNPGENIVVGNATYLIEDIYAAASGRQCKLIKITKNSPAGSGISLSKVACEQTHRWVFSKDVFLREADR